VVEQQLCFIKKIEIYHVTLFDGQFVRYTAVANAEGVGGLTPQNIGIKK